MRCPICQSQLQADAPDCPQCRLSFPRARTLLGAVPRLVPWVADTTGTLTPQDQRRLKRRLEEIQQRFPQLVPQVVLHHFPAEHPFTMHVFWLFNSANLAGYNNRGSDNHALMLALDPQRGEAAIMPGYGLEAFCTDEALGDLLGLGHADWENDRWTDGLLRVLDGMDAWLETIAVPTDAAAFQKGEY